MRILVAGCWRSGTTALYNIVRLICEANATTLGCFEDEYEKHAGLTFTHEVVKAHKFDEKWVMWADAIVTIYREPLDVWQSMERFAAKGGREYAAEDLLRGLAYWGNYNFHAKYQANYNQLSRSTEKLARQLGEKLHLPVDEKEIIKRLRQIKPPRSGYDPVTLLHFNHITQK